MIGTPQLRAHRSVVAIAIVGVVEQKGDSIRMA